MLKDSGSKIFVAIMVAANVIMGAIFLDLKNSSKPTEHVCKDVWFFKEGAVRTVVKEIKKQAPLLTIYERVNAVERLVGEFKVKRAIASDDGITVVNYMNKNIKLRILQDEDGYITGYPAQLEAHLPKRKLKASLGCEK